MPSALHEALVRLLSDCPALGIKLMRDELHIDIAEPAHIEVVSAEFAELSPAEVRADVVVRMDNDAGEAVHVFIFEAQLAIDAEKLYTWPLYSAGSRHRHRCPATVVVITLDEKVARWCSQPVEVDLAGTMFRALVVGPKQIPSITDIETAKAFPELAVLSTMAHGREEGAEAIGLAALAGCEPLDNARASLYADIIQANLGEVARRALEALMQQGSYTYQTEFAKKHFDAGEASGRLQGEADGRLKGEADGRRALLLELLEARFGKLSAEVTARVDQAGPEELSRWARQILTADSLQAVFAPAS